ncbi:MAG: argininosuccinate synthase, partial [Planctomycetota bacterium]|nr:argininosuccinate synthase [Planctomycetota bacterium]
RLKLYKGGVWVVGRKSPGSLYSPDVVSFDTIGSFNGTDAAGFIRLNALRLTLNRSLRWDG